MKKTTKIKERFDSTVRCSYDKNKECEHSLCKELLFNKSFNLLGKCPKCRKYYLGVCMFTKNTYWVNCEDEYRCTFEPKEIKGRVFVETTK